MIVGSLAFVRYEVNEKPKPETFVLTKSLSDGIRRGSNGTFYTVAASPDISDVGQQGKQPCPT